MCPISCVPLPETRREIKRKRKREREREGESLAFTALYNVKFMTSSCAMSSEAPTRQNVVTLAILDRLPEAALRRRPVTHIRVQALSFVFLVSRFSIPCSHQIRFSLWIIVLGRHYLHPISLERTAFLLYATREMLCCYTK